MLDGVHHIVDDSSGMDMDRDKIDKLMAWMEKDYVDEGESKLELASERKVGVSDAE